MTLQFKTITALLCAIVLLTNCSKNDDDGGNNSNENISFVTTWQTTSSNEEITIYTNGFSHVTTAYNYTVDWGDGEVSNGVTGNVSHTYTTAGAHTVSITGDFPAIRNWPDETNAAKLQTVESWGGMAWESMHSAFKDCINLSITATEVPDLSNVTSMRAMFYDATAFSQDLSGWATDNVTSCSDFATDSGLTAEQLPTAGSCF